MRSNTSTFERYSTFSNITLPQDVNNNTQSLFWSIIAHWSYNVRLSLDNLDLGDYRQLCDYRVIISDNLAIIAHWRLSPVNRAQKEIISNCGDKLAIISAGIKPAKWPIFSTVHAIVHARATYAAQMQCWWILFIQIMWKLKHKLSA